MDTTVICSITKQLVYHILCSNCTTGWVMLTCSFQLNRAGTIVMLCNVITWSVGILTYASFTCRSHDFRHTLGNCTSASTWTQLTTWSNHPHNVTKRGYILTSLLLVLWCTTEWYVYWHVFLSSPVAYVMCHTLHYTLQYHELVPHHQMVYKTNNPLNTHSNKLLNSENVTYLLVRGNYFM